MFGALNGEIRRDEIADYGLESVYEGFGMSLLSTAKLETWNGGSSQGWYWAPFEDQIRPFAWTDVMNYSMAPGVIHEHDGWRLHNDRLSMHDLYYTVDDGSVYFTNWMPLLTTALHPGDVDLEAWASILTLGFCPPGHSPLRAIRTLPAFTSLKVGHAAAHLEWDEPEYSRECTSNRSLLAAIYDALPPRSERAIYTLSGGWDSRLLTGLSVGWNGQEKVETWTTQSTEATDRERSLASQVAAYLETDHHEFVPSDADTTDAIRVAMKRLWGSTWMHSWFEPLASRLRSIGRPVVDGLAGDVLVKGLFQDPEDDFSGHQIAARYRLWERLGGWSALRKDVWSKKALEMFGDVGFRDFDASIRMYEDSERWQTLAVLTTRTATGIARSPQRLLAPELRVYYPFLNHDVLAMALDPSMHARRGHDLYRLLLRSLDPELGRIPSTNDEQGDYDKQAPVAASRRRLRFIRDVIHENGQFVDLLAPDLVNIIVRDDLDSLARISRWDAPMRALYGLVAYSLWLRDGVTSRGLVD